MARTRPGASLERLLKEQVDELKKLNARQASAAKGGVFGGVGAAVGATLGVPSPVAGFKALETTIGSFVQKANPAAMERFQLVLDDVTAVIGQTLAPVLEVLGQAARLVGDVLASILPSGAEMKEMLAPINDLLAELRVAIEPLIPILKEGLSFALKGLTLALYALMIPIQFFMGLLEGLLGDLVDNRRKLKDSTATAARNIRFEDPMSAIKSVYQAAFKGSFGAQPKEKNPLDKINEGMWTAVDWLKTIATDAKAIGKEIGSWLQAIAVFTRNILNALPVAEDATKGIAITGNIAEGVVKQFPELFRKAGPTTRQKALDQQGERYFRAEDIAKAIAMLPVGRELVAQASGLDQLIDEMRVLAKVIGNMTPTEAAIEDLYSWAGMTARRGVDGHPGGPGRGT